MQPVPFGIIVSHHSLRRYDDLCPVVLLQQIAQSSCMIIVSMRDEHIVHRIKVNAQQFSITDKEIAGTRVQQDAVLFRI